MHAPKVKNALERELLCAIFGATLEVSVECWRQERARRPVILRRAWRARPTRPY